MTTKLHTILFIAFSVLSFAQNATFQEKLLAPDGELNDRFGWAVDIQNDILVAGDIFDDSDSEPNTGAAYIYRKDSNGNFIFEQKLKAPFLEAFDNYATEVEINGNFIAVGSPRYRFADTANGFPLVNNAGAVFLYKYNTTTTQWELVSQIFAPTRQLNHLFGFRIVLTDTQIFISELEHRYASINATRSGKIHIYDYDSDGNITYNQGIDNPEPTSMDFFGMEIALSENTLAVGTIGEREDENGNNDLQFAGAVYIYEKDGTGIFNFQQKVVPNTREFGANFGEGLDINGDILIVSAVNETRPQPGTTNILDCGISYVFKFDGNTWSQTTLIEPPSIELNGSFGSSINVIGNTALISYEGGRVPFNSSSITSGLVNQITLDTNGQITNSVIIAPPFPDSTDEFGYITSWDDNQLAVGAYADRGDINGNILPEGGSGAVYIYNLDTTLSTDTFSSTVLKIKNPVKDKLTVFNLEKEVNYNIYDINGKSVLSGKINISNPNIDTSWIAKGFYILNLYIDNRHQNLKLIKE